MITRYVFIALDFLLPCFSYAQLDTIKLKNPSFEETPKIGNKMTWSLSWWIDCVEFKFTNE